MEAAKGDAGSASDLSSFSDYLNGQKVIIHCLICQYADLETKESFGFFPLPLSSLLSSTYNAF